MRKWLNVESHIIRSISVDWIMNLKIKKFSSKREMFL